MKKVKTVIDLLTVKQREQYEALKRAISQASSEEDRKIFHQMASGILLEAVEAEIEKRKKTNYEMLNEQQKTNVDVLTRAIGNTKSKHDALVMEIMVYDIYKEAILSEENKALLNDGERKQIEELKQSISSSKTEQDILTIEKQINEVFMHASKRRKETEAKE
ncbi:MAG: hypothetical protein LRY73_12420 [Bacillus sp. (in: Bacteria)]|nr:hypothetical protein [Bacillus sp. (in: firmicutes)]